MVIEFIKNAFCSDFSRPSYEFPSLFSRKLLTTAKSLHLTYLKHCYVKKAFHITLDSKIVRTRLLGYNQIVSSQLSDSEFGPFTYCSSNCVFKNARVGSFSSIGDNFKCFIGSHPLNYISTSPSTYTHELDTPTLISQSFFNEHHKYIDNNFVIHIGSDVWIGCNVIIMDGLKIGDGAVIAAGSVVTKSVPPYAIVGGVPARILKYRFEPEEINLLLRIKWWDWPISKIYSLSNQGYFCVSPFDFAKHIL